MNLDPKRPERRPGFGAVAWPILAALLVAGSAAVTGCDIQSPTLAPLVTTVPLEATPWPNGTVGQFGLQIDPTLLNGLPETVGGLPLGESAPLEIQALDTSDLPTNFVSFAAAQAGSFGDTDSLSVDVGKVRDAYQNDDDFFASWSTDFDAGVCSQADGIASTSKQTINDWDVVVATCKGGPIAYTLWIENGLLVSIQANGPRHLGVELINAIN